MTQSSGYKDGVKFALLSVLLVTVAQISMKLGVMNLPFNTLNAIHIDSILRFITQQWTHLAWLALGLMCYALSMLVWVVGLKYLPLSIAYPLLSISYVLVYFVSMLVPQFSEHFSIVKLSGIILIIVGLKVFFSGSKAKS